MGELILKRRPWWAIGLIALLTGGLLGCSIITSNSTPIKEGKADISKYVKLSMCIPAAPSTGPIADYEGVVQELNHRLEEKFNAHVEVTFIPGQELGLQYPLIFESNESFDILYTGIEGRPSYFRLVEEEYLKPLDELLPIYAKEILKDHEPWVWKEIEYEGKIYGIPFGGPRYRTEGYIYRGDLLLEYGMPPLTTMEDMEAYLDAVLREDGGLIPLALNEDRTIGLYDMFIDLNTSWIPAPGLPKSSLYLVAKDYQRPEDIFHPAFTTEFMEFARLMRSWGDRGYWQGDIFENPIDAMETLNNHRAASILGDLEVYNLERNMYPNPIDLEGENLKFFSFGGKRDKIIRGSTAENLIGFSGSSGDIGRAIMVAQYIIDERETFGILDYGFGGQIGNRVDRDSQKPYGTWAIEDPYARFSFDSVDLDEEIDNILEANARFGIPILLGKAGDPERAVLGYRRELKNGGVDKLIDALKDQFKAIDKTP